VITLRAAVERWPLREAFTIARGAKTEAVVVVVHASRGAHVGRGEALPYARYGEDPDGVARVIEELGAVESRASLMSLPAGAARNAIDLALWDLEAKERGVPVWQLAGLDAPEPCITAHTIPLRSLAETRALARREAHRALLKIKAGGEDDLARIEAVREEAPGARLIVDANEGWSLATLQALAPRLVPLGVEVLEQPLPAGEDAVLAGWESPIPLCADESFHGGPSELSRLVGRYQAVNVKLDKQGGLTTALLAVERARELGLEVMVGTMVATSLAVAPAVLLASRARWADLDAAMFLSPDRAPGLVYSGSLVYPASGLLWG
jgi:L-alanine-DL-glutamate epimerase-like enolase superfamily enzyme